MDINNSTELEDFLEIPEFELYWTKLENFITSAPLNDIERIDNKHYTLVTLDDVLSLPSASRENCLFDLKPTMFMLNQFVQSARSVLGENTPVASILANNFVWADDNLHDNTLNVTVSSEVGITP